MLLEMYLAKMMEISIQRVILELRHFTMLLEMNLAKLMETSIQ